MRRGILVGLMVAGRLFCQTSGSAPTESRVLSYGFELRMRNENWNNLLDFDDEKDDQMVRVRYRTRLWAKLPLSSAVDFHLGINQETAQVITPHKPFRFDELMFETAYVEVKKLGLEGLKLKLGRQNINKGEGFLLFDGSPGDGSRAFFFNAAVAEYTRRSLRLEALFWNNTRDDRYLPRLHPGRWLVEWNSQAAGVYLTETGLKNTSLEGYYFRNRETDDLRLSSHPLFQPDRRFQTLGGRLVHKVGKGVSWTGELAAQRGTQQDGVKIGAYGGYSYVKKTFDAAGKNYLLGGYWRFSGDDPATMSKNEGWNPLFGRWPKYSELYLITLSEEKGPGYWSNLSLWQAEVACAPTRTTGLRFTVYRMGAFHARKGAPSTFGAGKLRGHMPQVRFDYALNKNWKGHLLYEYFKPGNFYSKLSPAWFLRFEVIYSYAGTRAM